MHNAAPSSRYWIGCTRCADSTSISQTAAKVSTRNSAAYFTLREAIR
jgi:hypothetical protein